MKPLNPALKWLIPLIFILAVIAALAGVWPSESHPYTITNFRGEEVTINAGGLYYWDTFSSATQAQANDLVMLVLGMPLLAISTWLTLRGSLRGRLLLTGILGFHPVHLHHDVLRRGVQSIVPGLCSTFQPELVRLHPDHDVFRS